MLSLAQTIGSGGFMVVFLFTKRMLSQIRFQIPVKGVVHLPTIALLFYMFSASQAFGIQCELEIVNEWGTGYTASVKITNDTEQSIDGWSVSIDYSDATQINNTWNAKLTGANPYLASNANYNGSIGPNRSVTFGFNASKGVANTPVTLPVLGDSCASDTSNLPPDVVATSSTLSGVSPLIVEFDASQSSDPEGATILYSWDFGDGNYADQASPTHTYSQAGDYRASLIVSDGILSAPPVYFDVKVESPPLSDAVCEFSVNNDWLSGFTGQIRVYNHTDATIEGWNVSLSFDDNTSLSGVWDASYSGNNPYQISNANYNQTIESGGYATFGFNAQKGTSGSAPTSPMLGGVCGSNVDVNQKPIAVANVSPRQGVAPLTVTMTALESNDPDGDTLTYLWGFDDGSTSTQAELEKTFEQPGSYNVSLTVNDGEISSDIVNIGIEVLDPTAQVGYQLNPQKSSLYFVSTKKTHLMENHFFTDMAGNISPTGEASLTIDLNSVETGIDIRNQRMRDYLFETTSFPEAVVNLNLDMEMLTNIAQGASIKHDISAQLSLHGFTALLETQVKITKLTETSLMVQNVLPIIVNASDFDLEAGIETLRELASLSVISYTVPTNFTLIFDAQP